MTFPFPAAILGLAGDEKKVIWSDLLFATFDEVLEVSFEPIIIQVTDNFNVQLAESYSFEAYRHPGVTWSDTLQVTWSEDLEIDFDAIVLQLVDDFGITIGESVSRRIETEPVPVGFSADEVLQGVVSLSWSNAGVSESKVLERSRGGQFQVIANPGPEDVTYNDVISNPLPSEFIEYRIRFASSSSFATTSITLSAGGNGGF